MRPALLSSIIIIVGCGGTMERSVEPVQIEARDPNPATAHTAGVGGGRLRVQYYSEPMTMCSVITNDAWTNWITQHSVYESLLASDPTDAPTYPLEGELAVALPEISEGGRVHTFRLRPNVRFHDGTALTSEDVVATFNLIRDQRVRAVHLRSYMEDLVRYHAPDERTVVFEWARPVFMSLDVYSIVPILPSERLVDPELFNDLDTNPLLSMPVGTGPWRFVEWERNSRIRLQRNDNYWGQAPHLENLDFIHVPESSVGIDMLHRGELDVVTRVPPAQWNRVAPDEGRPYRINLLQPNNYAWIGWNQQRPIFARREVRQALTQLVDRAAIIRMAPPGLRLPSHCHFFGPLPECDLEREPWAYDPEAAIRTLEQAGFRDRNGDGVRERGAEELRFTLMVPASSTDARVMAGLIQASFASAGVAMEIVAVEWAEYVVRLRDHQFDAATLLWADTSARTDPSQIWHSRSIADGSNYISFSHPRADAILDQAVTEWDPEQRVNLFREFGQILHEEQPYVWLYTRTRVTVLDRRIRNATETLWGYRFRDWSWGPQPTQSDSRRP